MKTIIVLAVCIAFASAARQQSYSSGGGDILRSEQDIQPDGSFSFAYETSDGTVHQAQGNADSVRGSYKFISPEGETVDITYVADENGYQPTGSHIPVAPPVPEAILRALEYIRTHPPADDSRSFARG